VIERDTAFPRKRSSLRNTPIRYIANRDLFRARSVGARCIRINNANRQNGEAKAKEAVRECSNFKVLKRWNDNKALQIRRLALSRFVTLVEFVDGSVKKAGTRLAFCNTATTKGDPMRE